MSLGKRVASFSSIRSSSQGYSPGHSSGTDGSPRGSQIQGGNRLLFPPSGRKLNLSSVATSSEDDRRQLRVDPDEIVYKTSSLALLRAKNKKSKARNVKSEDESGREGTTDSFRHGYLSAARRVLDFMCTMWHQQKFCDMVLQLPRGELHAHKIVFAAHSSALAEKFTNFPPDEVISLDLSDFQPEIVFAVTNFLYTTDLDITDETVGQLLTCASEIGVGAIVELCREYLSNYNIHNAILYHSIAETEGIADLRDDIFDFICRNFSEIVQSKHFPSVKFEKISSLLSLDSLGVKSELEVFYAVVTWVNYDRPTRMPLAPMLMRCVRLQLIDPEVLVTRVETVDWIFDARECHNLLFEAYKYHSLRLGGSNLASSFQSQKPRLSSPGGALTPRRFRTSLHYDMSRNPDTQEVEFIERKRQSFMPAPAQTKLLVAAGGIDLQSLDPDVPGRYIQQLDPVSQQWRPLSTLQEYTHHHGAVVLGGKLYIVGGAIYNLQNPSQLGRPTNAVHVYDPQSGVWSSAAPLRENRAYHSTVVWNNQILAIGGEKDDNQKLNTIEFYDPVEDSWELLTRMPGGARLGCACAVYGDLLYIVGGFSSSRGGTPVLADVDCFNLMQQRWIQKKALKVPRCHASLAVVLGRLFLIGGRTKLKTSKQITSLPMVMEYDVIKDEWNHVTDTKIPRHDMGVAVIGSRLYIIGGMTSTSSECLSSVECLDLATGSWIEGMSPLPYPVTGLACCTLQGS